MYYYLYIIILYSHIDNVDISRGDNIKYWTISIEPPVISDKG